MSKAIIIDNAENISLVDYKGYETIRDSVGGFIEICGRLKIPLIDKAIPVIAYCNEEFLINDDEKFDKINALSSILVGEEIRGNVCLTVDEGNGEDRGFEYEETPDGEEDFCECWFVEDILMRIAESEKENIDAIHKKYDGNKSEPSIAVTEWDEEEMEFE